jgi:hypothetical protein
VTYAKDFNISVKDAIGHEYLQDLFHLPLSQQAYEEFLNMEEICINFENSIQQGNLDSWTYIWGSNIISTKKGLSPNEWRTTDSSPLFLDLEVFMPV